MLMTVWHVVVFRGTVSSNVFPTSRAIARANVFQRLPNGNDEDDSVAAAVLATSWELYSELPPAHF